MKIPSQVDSTETVSNRGFQNAFFRLCLVHWSFKEKMLSNGVDWYIWIGLCLSILKTPDRQWYVYTDNCILLYYFC